jgi:hypothetical protein
VFSQFFSTPLKLGIYLRYVSASGFNYHNTHIPANTATVTTATPDMIATIANIVAVFIIINNAWNNFYRMPINLT